MFPAERAIHLLARTTRPSSRQQSSSSSATRADTRADPDREGLTTKINWQLWVVACCRRLNVHVSVIYYSNRKISLSHFIRTLCILREFMGLAVGWGSCQFEFWMPTSFLKRFFFHLFVWLFITAVLVVVTLLLICFVTK